MIYKAPKSIKNQGAVY